MPQRLDLYCTTHSPFAKEHFSRSFFQKFIRRFGVKVNGKLMKKPHCAVSATDRISLDIVNLRRFLDESKTQDLVPFSLPSDQIIFNGKDFFVVDKPPGIRTEDITSGFLAVHRLDKDTSGVLVIAKNQGTQAALAAQWSARCVKKTYIALVKGKLEPKKGAIEAPIFRSSLDRKKMAVSSSKKARPAYTEYEVIKHFQPCTLIKLFPKTGRTHQIRVHLASIGHPVISDSLYGDKQLNKKIEQKYGLRRQFLHASELTLKHPKTKKNMTFASQLPEDLEMVLRGVSPAKRG